MPKASVDKDHLATAGENDVGFAGQFEAIKPKARAQSVCDLAHRFPDWVSDRSLFSPSREPSVQ
jgi:hypothetical protein